MKGIRVYRLKDNRTTTDDPFNRFLEGELGSNMKGSFEQEDGTWFSDQDLAEFKQEIWGAARSGITTAIVSIPEICVPVGDDSEHFKYKDVIEYENTKVKKV